MDAIKIDNLIDEDLDEFNLYLVGSNPVSVSERVERYIGELSAMDAATFVNASVLACATQRRPLTDYLMLEDNKDVLGFVMRFFSLKGNVNFTALSLIGHCILAAPINDCGNIIPLVRSKFGGLSIWEADLDKLSGMQKNILVDKVIKYGFKNAKLAGQKMLTAIQSLSPVPGVSKAMFEHHKDANDEIYAGWMNKYKHIIQKRSVYVSETRAVISEQQVSKEALISEKVLGKRKVGEDSTITQSKKQLLLGHPKRKESALVIRDKALIALEEAKKKELIEYERYMKDRADREKRLKDEIAALARRSVEEDVLDEVAADADLPEIDLEHIGELSDADKEVAEIMRMKVELDTERFEEEQERLRKYNFEQAVELNVSNVPDVSGDSISSKSVAKRRGRPPKAKRGRSASSRSSHE